MEVIFERWLSQVSINSTSPKRSDSTLGVDLGLVVYISEFPLIPLLRREATYSRSSTLMGMP